MKNPRFVTSGEFPSLVYKKFEELHGQIVLTRSPLSLLQVCVEGVQSRFLIDMKLSNFSREAYPYTHNGNVFVSACAALDHYIAVWEDANGEISVGQPTIRTDDTIMKIIKLMWKIISDQQHQKESAYETVNMSNKIMENMLADLQTVTMDSQYLEMNSFRSMSTDALLAVDPHCLFGNVMPCNLSRSPHNMEEDSVQPDASRKHSRRNVKF